MSNQPALLLNYSLKILEHHLDTFGHVNNATYLSLYEEARWDFIEKHGYGLAHVQKIKIGPVILEAHLTFKRELINRETIRIESQFREMKNKLVMILDQRILKEDGSVASTLELHVGLMDLNQRKLIPPTPEWLSAIGVSEA